MDVKRAEQGGELAVEVDAHLGNWGKAEAGDLRTGLVGVTRACGISPASR
jgi:hypothetical protein